MTNNIKKSLNAQSGFILLTSYMLISTMSILSLAVFSRGSSYLNATERNANKIIAFNMGEAGVDMALSQLAVDPAYAGSNGYISLQTNNIQGGYSVVVTTPAGFPETRLIQATGFSPGNVSTARSYEMRQISVYAELGSMSFFNFAVFADETMQINGNPVIDSYDSRLGNYGGSNIAANGDIGTNSISSGGVSLVGNATVNGDAEVGPGANPSSVVSVGPNAVLNGNAAAASGIKSYTAAATTGISQGNLRIAGNTTYTLAAGTYRFDSLSITGKGRLQALGPVEIYVDGSVNIGGNGVVTQANLPPNFIIYVTTSDTVSLHGNGAFYGAVYAPDSHVHNVGNGELYGAVVSNTYQQSGNGNVHYDEALNEIGSNANAGVTMKSWNEQNTAAWGMGQTSQGTYSGAAN